MGLKPALWGADQWGVIHVNAKRLDGFREAGAKVWVERLQAWFRCLPEGLPCEGCYEHARQYLQEHPLPEDAQAFAWSVDFHNHVNARLGKRQFSVAEAEQRLVERYGTAQVEKLTQAEAMRREDAQKIQRLIAELERLGAGDPDADPRPRLGYKVVWFLVGCLTAAAFFVTLWLLNRLF